VLLLCVARAVLARRGGAALLCSEAARERQRVTTTAAHGIRRSLLVAVERMLVAAR
jgi:hypothetical protein